MRALHYKQVPAEADASGTALEVTRRDYEASLSYALRIGLLTGPCYGRIRAAALVALRQSLVGSRGRLTLQRAWLTWH